MLAPFEDAGEHDADDEDDGGHGEHPRFDGREAGACAPVEGGAGEHEGDGAGDVAQGGGEQKGFPVDAQQAAHVVDKVVGQEDEAHDQDGLEAVVAHAVGVALHKAGGLFVVEEALAEVAADGVGDHRRKVAGDDDDRDAPDWAEQEAAGERQDRSREEDERAQRVDEDVEQDTVGAVLHEVDDVTSGFDKVEVVGPGVDEVGDEKGGPERAGGSFCQWRPSQLCGSLCCGWTRLPAATVGSPASACVCGTEMSVPVISALEDDMPVFCLSFAKCCSCVSFAVLGGWQVSGRRAGLRGSADCQRM